MDSVADIVAGLWRDAPWPASALDALTLEGREAGLGSSFRAGAVAQATIAATALAAAAFDHERGGGPMQQVAVDFDHACAEFRSEQLWRIDGAPAPPAWDRIAGAYRCGDGRWLRIHTNFAHHRDGVLALLGCAYEREAVQAALGRWSAEAFETQATARGLVVAMMRSFDEWDAHPQGKALHGAPLWDAERLDDATPRPGSPSRRDDMPLSGIRVLDVTRILAGPVATRALAAYGADVMTVNAAHLPSIDAVVDTGRGKRACFADLREPAGRKAFARLVEGCDVIVQGYRPGALDALGFGPEALARLRPGIVVVSLSAYGGVADGPWSGKRGFDSLVQTATGFNDAEARAAGVDSPRPLPFQVLDHGTGFLMAFAAMAALSRQRHAGGSWHVRASLARTAQWLRSLGRVALEPSARADAVPAAWLETTPSAWGRLSAVRPAARLSRTSPRYARPSPRLGTHAPGW
jgi:crotonobetainyl-CoA:carnitine CoA-transferase CaiB-like acyl-CoA transferase